MPTGVVENVLIVKLTIAPEGCGVSLSPRSHDTIEPGGEFTKASVTGCGVPEMVLINTEKRAAHPARIVRGEGYGRVITTAYSVEV